MSKVWFITGAGRGIGAHIVQSALAAGDRVVATGRSLAQLRDAFGGIDSARIALVAFDVADAGQAGDAVQAALAAFGRIDVVVNNAAYGQLGRFEEVSSGDAERQFAVNVHGVMHVLRAALPVLRAQRAGHIINIASIGGVTGFDGASIYCASKYAIEGLSASLALEVAPFGIHVTVVEPGFFRTEFLQPVSVRYGAALIEDYADRPTTRDAYGPYNGVQPGDPAKLGLAIIRLAAMDAPPLQFLAGSDALAMAQAAIEARVQSMAALAALSASTDFAA